MSRPTNEAIELREAILPLVDHIHKLDQKLGDVADGLALIHTALQRIATNIAFK